MTIKRIKKDLAIPKVHLEVELLYYDGPIINLLYTSNELFLFSDEHVKKVKDYFLPKSITVETVSHEFILKPKHTIGFRLSLLYPTINTKQLIF